MKPASSFSFAFLALSVCTLVGCTAAPGNDAGGSSSSSSSIPLGGDRDEHGCIPSAGYQWCEAKEKCIRLWEEPCASSGSALDTSGWSTYRNTTLGFSLQLPPSWEGYRATEEIGSQNSYVGFSFSGAHRPFEIFKIMKFTQAQWKKLGTNPPFTVLTQSADTIFVCDGCCEEGGDVRGGGQFDTFQQQRCGEVPKTLQTFQVLQ